MLNHLWHFLQGELFKEFYKKEKAPTRELHVARKIRVKICTCFLPDIINSQHGKELVEGLPPHVRGEERHDGGHVGDEAKQAQT